MKDYNFDMLLGHMAKLDSLKAVIDATCLADASANRDRKRSPRRSAEKGDITRFVGKIGDFLFFMRHVNEDAKSDFKRSPRPGNISDADFEKYRPVVEALVIKKELHPKALQLFSTPK